MIFRAVIMILLIDTYLCIHMGVETYLCIHVCIDACICVYVRVCV